MSDYDEEHLAFLVEASEAMRRARLILEEAQQAPKGLLRDAAIEMAMIEYIRSFTTCRGRHGEHTITRERVPQALREKHDVVKKMRNQFLAHADMKPRDAMVRFRKIKDVEVRTIVQTHYEPIYEVGGIDALIELIDGVLPLVYDDIEAGEAKLRG